MQQRLEELKEHFIIKMNNHPDGNRQPTSVGTNKDNNCYPTYAAAEKQAKKLAENASKPQLIIYKAVAEVGQDLPTIHVRKIKNKDRYSCKANNCEDTECSRCFPTTE